MLPPIWWQQHSDRPVNTVPAWVWEVVDVGADADADVGADVGADGGVDAGVDGGVDGVAAGCVV